METIVGISGVLLPATISNSSALNSLHPIRSWCSVSRNDCYHSCSVSPNYLFATCNNKSRRNAVIVGAKKRSDNTNKRVDTHSFAPRPDEATGPFPEAILLKEKMVQEDGELRPEFADADEEELFEYLNLQLESDVDVERRRHYEVVYLIHENHKDQVADVNAKVEDFLKEKRGKVWRFSDWGMRRLAYKIKKAKHAHYILMNFEIEAKWINDFKSMLDMDERVIRHLVIKRDKAITEYCPPPPEFHTLRGGMDDDDDVYEVDDLDADDVYDDEDESWDDGDELEEGFEDDDIEHETIPVKENAKQLA